jgi:hypothetical protein
MLTAGAMAALPELVRRPLAAFAAEYLAAGVPFGGRDEELAALDAWLGDPQRPCALVVARAGRGKSALLARWTRSIAARVPDDAARCQHPGQPVDPIVQRRIAPDPALELDRRPIRRQQHPLEEQRSNRHLRAEDRKAGVGTACSGRHPVVHQIRSPGPFGRNRPAAVPGQGHFPVGDRPAPGLSGRRPLVAKALFRRPRPTFCCRSRRPSASAPAACRCRRGPAAC